MNIVSSTDKNQVIEFVKALFHDEDIILFRNIETWEEDATDKNGEPCKVKESKVCDTWYLTAEQLDWASLENADDIAARKRCNQFFGVCPRPHTLHDFACQIDTVRCLWSDIDDCEPELALCRVKRVGLPIPSAVVASGHGTHLYWFLASPESIPDAFPETIKTEYEKKGKAKKKHAVRYDLAGNKVEPSDLLCERAKWLQELIANVAQDIGGDTTSDLSRLLRIPGTWNRKNERNGVEPVPCDLVSLTDTRYALEDFRQWFPVVKEKTAVAPTTGTNPLTTDLDGLIEHCRTAEDRSKADALLFREAVRLGIDKEALRERVKDMGKFAERGDYYFEKTWQYAVNDPKTQEFAQKRVEEEKVNAVVGAANPTATKPSESVGVAMAVASGTAGDVSDVIEAVKTKETTPPSWTRVISAAELDSQEFKVEWLVDGMIAAAQPLVIGGRLKSLKTSIATDLLVSLASGTKFLGQWQCKKTKCCFWSGESGIIALQNTQRRICRERGIDLKDCSLDWSFELPELYNQDHREWLKKTIVEREYGLVMIDPAYVCLLDAKSAGNAGNVYAMGHALLPLSQIGQETKCAMSIVHHFAKWSPSVEYRPAELGELSQSGVAEWARQWILMSRRLPYDKTGEHFLYMVAGGSMGQAFECGVDVDEGYPHEETKLRTRWKLKVRGSREAEADDKERKAEARVEAKAERTTTLMDKILATMADGTPRNRTEIVKAFGGRANDEFKEAVKTLLGNGSLTEIETLNAQNKKVKMLVHEEVNDEND